MNRLPPAPMVSPTLRALCLQIMRLAWPICSAVAIGALAQLVIAAMLGHMGAEALYIRSVFIPVSFIVLAVLEGFDVATQVGFARLQGQQKADAPHPRPVVSSSMLGAFVAGGCLTLLGVTLLVTVLAPALAELLGVPETVLEDFLRFALWTTIASVLSTPASIMAAALRGWGRTGAAAIVSLIVAAVQVLVVWLVGQVSGVGVASVPIAILTSALVGAGVGVILLVRAGMLRTRREHGRSVSRTSGLRVPQLVLGVGLPVALSYFLLSLTSLAAMWILAPFGQEVVAGYGAAVSVQTMLIVPAIGLAAATSIVMNQQWGAGALVFLPRTFRSGCILAFTVYLVVGVFAFVAAIPLSHLLSGDDAVIAQSTLYLSVVGPSYLGMGVMLYFVTVLEQIGYGAVAVGLNVLYYAVSLGCGGILATLGRSPVALYTTIAIANAAGLIVLSVVSILLVKRRASGPVRPSSGDVA